VLADLIEGITERWRPRAQLRNLEIGRYVDSGCRQG